MSNTTPQPAVAAATPRTDAECFREPDGNPADWVVPADFARQLERELIAATSTPDAVKWPGELAYIKTYVIPEKDRHAKYWHDLAQERVVSLSDMTTERNNWRDTAKRTVAELASLRARVAELEKDRERAENHLRGVLETTSSERERDRIDAERFRMLSSRCEELDDNPEGYYFALPIDGKSSDVFERFTAAIDAARAKEDAT